MRSKDMNKEKVIIETALAMITEVGLSGFKMSDLAKKADLATGTLYIYFKNKEDVIRSIFIYILHTVSTDVNFGIDRTRELKDNFKQICYIYVSELVKHPEYKIFLDQFFRSPYCEPTDFAFYDESAFTNSIYKLIKSAQEQKILKPMAPELIILLTRGTLQNYAMQVIHSQKMLEMEVFDEVFDFIWTGGSVN